MPRPRSENYDDIKDQILQAAARLFAEKGFLNTNIVEIGEACNASKSRMYHYFASKNEILAAMLLQHASGLIERATVALKAKGSDAQKFANFIAAHFDFYLSHPDRQAVLLHDAAYLLPEDAKALKVLERRLVAMLATLLQGLGGKPLHAKPAATAHAMLIYGMLNWIYTWYKPRGPIKPAQLAEYAARLCLYGLLPESDRRASG
jgi:AcrR family transcriptional regulator